MTGDDHGCTLTAPNGESWEWLAIPWHKAEAIWRYLGQPDLTTGLDDRQQRRHGELT